MEGRKYDSYPVTLQVIELLQADVGPPGVDISALLETVEVDPAGRRAFHSRIVEDSPRDCHLRCPPIGNDLCCCLPLAFPLQLRRALAAQMSKLGSESVHA